MRTTIGWLICFVLGFLLGRSCTGLRDYSSESRSTVVVEKNASQWTEQKPLIVQSRGNVVQAHQEFNSTYHGIVSIDTEIPKSAFERNQGIDIGVGYIDRMFLVMASYRYRRVSFYGLMGIPVLRDKSIQGGVMVSVTLVSW